MTKKLSILLIVILLAKLLAVLAGSYPFDFASFVYQARSFFEYGIHPLFYWNKGLPLLGVFYSQYSLYQYIVSTFGHSFENTILLHLLYKFVFFACDILTAYFISKIIRHLTGRPDLAKYGALIWLINPFLLWSIEFHGSYAIVAVLFNMVSLLLFLKKRYVLSVVFLALGTSVYYYAAIFLPFYILKRAYEANKRPIMHAGQVALVFFAAIAVCYLPYFFNAQFAHDLIASLANHSAPNASPFAAAIQLPTYSLLKIPFFLVAHYFPTNQDAPELFKIVGLVTFLGVILVVLLAVKSSRFYFHRTVYSLYARRKIYDDKRFIFDQLIAITLFLLLVGNLQDHYLAWVFPYMIICALAYGKQFMFRNVLLISFTALFIVISANNIGIYLLDVVPFGTVSTYLGQSQFLLSLFGFILMLMLGANLFIARQKTVSANHVMLGNTGWTIMPVALCVIIGGVSLLALAEAVSMHTPTQLGSDARVYNFVYNPNSVTQSNPDIASQNIPIEDADFSAERPGLVTQNQYVNPGKSPWFFYNYQGLGSHILSITNVGGTNAMTITPGGSQHAIQLNLGHGTAIGSIAVDHDHLYTFSVKVQNNGLQPNDYKASIRFRDQYGNIIPASDLKLEPESGTNIAGWITYSSNFAPPENASFLEPLFTVSTSAHEGAPPGANVKFTDFSLQDTRSYVTVAYNNLSASSNNTTIEKYVLSPPANQYFHFIVTIPKDDFSESMQQITLNTCAVQNVPFDEQDFVYIAQFKPACFIKGKANKLTYTTINFPSQPQAQVSLIHTSNPRSIVTYHHATYKLFVIIGVLLTATLLITSGLSVFRL